MKKKKIFFLIIFIIQIRGFSNEEYMPLKGIYNNQAITNILQGKWKQTIPDSTFLNFYNDSIYFVYGVEYIVRGIFKITPINQVDYIAYDDFLESICSKLTRDSLCLVIETKYENGFEDYGIILFINNTKMNILWVKNFIEKAYIKVE